MITPPNDNTRWYGGSPYPSHILAVSDDLRVHHNHSSDSSCPATCPHYHSGDFWLGAPQSLSVPARTRVRAPLPSPRERARALSDHPPSQSAPHCQTILGMLILTNSAFPPRNPELVRMEAEIHTTASSSAGGSSLGTIPRTPLIGSYYQTVDLPTSSSSWKGLHPGRYIIKESSIGPVLHRVVPSPRSSPSVISRPSSLLTDPSSTVVKRKLGSPVLGRLANYLDKEEDQIFKRLKLT